MSRWRKIAVEALPGFKSSVEVSKSPDEMWTALGRGYVRSLHNGSRDICKFDQVFQFAHEVRCFSNNSYLARNVGEFVSLRTAADMMPSWREFILEVDDLNRFFLEMWPSLFFRYYYGKDNGIPDSKLARVAEAVTFAVHCSRDNVPSSRISGGLWHFSHMYAGQFSRCGLTQATLFAPFLPQDVFESWLPSACLSPEEERQARSTYSAGKREANRKKGPPSKHKSKSPK